MFAWRPFVGTVAFLIAMVPLAAFAAAPVIKIEKVERTVDAIAITGTAGLIPVGTKFKAEVRAINGRRLNDAQMKIAGIDAFEVPSNRRFEVRLQRYGSLDAFDFPAGKYEVEFLAHFNGAWQSTEVLKAVGVPVDDQGRTGLDAEPSKLPSSPDLKRISGYEKPHRILSAIRTISIKPMEAPQVFGRTKSIQLEIHDTSPAANRNPVRTIPADHLLQRDVLKAVGRVTPSQAIVLACKGPFPLGYIATDLYFSGGRPNPEMRGQHATTLKEACFTMEKRCRAC